MRCWSCEAGSLLDLNKYQVLRDPTISLKLRSEGYDWYQRHLSDKKYVQVSPSDHPTQVEGCEKIWLVASSKTPREVSMRILASKRLSGRFEISSRSFDDHMTRRSSCWIVEQKGENFYCDCPTGSRGFVCKHFVGLSYKLGLLQVTEDVLSDQLTQKLRPAIPVQPPCPPPPPETVPLVRFHQSGHNSGSGSTPALRKYEED